MGREGRDYWEEQLSEYWDSGLTIQEYSELKFWEYHSPGSAGKFLDQWCHAANYSRIAPMKGLAKMLTAHRSLILLSQSKKAV